jgi:hypothetical protein
LPFPISQIAFLLRAYLALLPTYQRSLRCDHIAITGQGSLDFDNGPTPRGKVHPFFNAVMHYNNGFIFVQVHVAFLAIAPSRRRPRRPFASFQWFA